MDQSESSTSLESPALETEELKLAASFDELLRDTGLIETLRRANIHIPTEIQSRAVPVLIDGKDAILQAQTGSGKTLAFVLPLISQLRNTAGGRAWSSLLITPTRELALQIDSVVRSIAPDIAPVCVIGGADMQAQIRGLRQDSRVVVGTPGRILDLLRQKELKLQNCRFFVVDEVDELLSTGFLEDVRHILSRLPDKRQGVFCSATVTPRVEMLAHSFLSKPERIIAGSEEPTVEHLYCEVGGDLLAKTVALCDIVETLRPRSAIIFCNTKSDTQLVEALLRRRGFDARRINSDLTQKQRNRIMKLIRDQELQLLVATDVAARGIDIEQLDLVVNYAIHDQPESYVHRTGRTGRAGRSGRAISLVGPRDFGAFHHLTKVLPIRFEKLVIPGDNEVADARLTHLYELLRVQEIELKERDLLVARQLLREQGSIEEPSENLEMMVAKLCRSAIEHSLGLEAKGLDEEELQGEDETRESRPPRQQQNRRGDEGERRDSRARSDSERPDGERREHPRDHSRQSEGRHDERRGDDRRGPDRAGEERRRDHDRPDDGRQRRDGERREHPQRAAGEEAPAPRENAPRQLRVYVGQGTRHGMTPEVFVSLAADFAELDPAEIVSSRFREIYGFVDINEPAATSVIEALNGIEYNGQLLPVEVAMVKEPQDRYRGNQRSRGRGRDGGRGGRSRDGRNSRERGDRPRGDRNEY